MYDADLLAAVTATDRTLKPAECAELARRAAAAIDAEVLPRSGPGVSVLLWEDAHSSGWLDAEWERRDTGYHDHDGSAVGVYVIDGNVTNEGLPVAGVRRVGHYGPGGSFHFPGTGIHRMDHEGGAITIHVYSPPLRAIGYYELVDGLLQRTIGPADMPSPASPQLLELLAGSGIQSPATVLPCYDSHRYRHVRPRLGSLARRARGEAGRRARVPRDHRAALAD